jgi:hypothetical protein
MYENYPENRAPIGTALRAHEVDRNPTVEENIDAKIAYFESEIARLKQSKEDLAPLLKMRIRDIQQAMNY